MAPTTPKFKPTRAELLRRSADLDEEQARIKRQLAELEASTVEVYSTEHPDRFPPGKRTRRAARDAIRVVPGADRLGNIYSVSQEAYRAHHGRRVTAPVRLLPAHAADDAAGVEAALEAAGLRSTRRTA